MATDRPDETFQVTILNSPVVNAFALPNGRLYVTRGLLALANDTSEVAAVLSHEIAHVTLRHASQRSELQARSDLIERVAENVLNDARRPPWRKDQAGPRWRASRGPRNSKRIKPAWTCWPAPGLTPMAPPAS